MTLKQKQRLLRIHKKWRTFKYGLGQTDKDIKFLLRILLGDDIDKDLE